MSNLTNKVCKFCGSHKVRLLQYHSHLKKIPLGLTRNNEALFVGIQCRICGSIENKNKFDPNKYFDGYYSNFSNYSRDILEPKYDYTGKLIERLKKDKEKKILDFGAGEGNLALYLREQGYNIDVLEADPGYTKLLEKNFTRVYRDISQLVGLYDVVLSLGVLEHVSEPVDHIKEICNNVLKPDGVYIAQFPNPKSLGARLNLQRWDMLFESGHNFIPSAIGLKIFFEKNKKLNIRVIESYSSSITSRGRIPWFPTRHYVLEKYYKKLINKFWIFDKLNKLLWNFQDIPSLGETTVVMFEKHT